MKIELTIEEFNKVPKDAIFAEGITTNDEEGVYLTDYREGDALYWIAKKGRGNDWAVYADWLEDKTIEEIAKHGQKITNEKNIRKLVPCADEVFKKYRH